jgi:glycosyltransferase involved in cell wall biosynthesis
MGKWSHRIAEALRALGHAPTLWFADDFPGVGKTRRFAVLLFPAVLAARLWREASRFDVVVIHEPSGFWYGLLRRFVPRLPPLVAMCHNVESKCFREFVEADRRGFAHVRRQSRWYVPLFRTWQADGAIRLADQVVCLSGIDRDYLVRRLGRPAAGVTWLVNGVAPEDFQEQCHPTPAMRGLFVGGWLDVKGRRLLPQLWARVLAEFPQARLTLVGTGLAAEAVLADFPPQTRASLQVVPRLTADGAMATVYAEHDLFLMPSLTEGSPLSLLEAMAAGMPVAAARVGGIPDVVTHERDGLLFPRMDAEAGAAQVCRLLGDPALAARLGRAARERMRELPWAAAARTLEAALIRAVAGKRRKGSTEARHVRRPV